jgi:hypothetical protein
MIEAIFDYIGIGYFLHKSVAFEAITRNWADEKAPEQRTVPELTY